MSLILMEQMLYLLIAARDANVSQAVLLPEGERTFSCTLHGQEVQLVCHDVMQLSTLQRLLAKGYGHYSLCVC